MQTIKIAKNSNSKVKKNLQAKHGASTYKVRQLRKYSTQLFNPVKPEKK